MYLEIVTPEAVLFSSEIDSLSVPGIQGEFQILNNHAPIVSLLKQGTVKIETNEQAKLNVEELNERLIASKNSKELTLEINSGTLELKDNKIILLAD